MNTLNSSLDLNKRLIRDFFHYLFPNRDIKPVEYLLEYNLIDGAIFVEKAMAQTGGLEICPIGYHQDFTDGSDSKTITLQYWSGTQYKWNKAKTKKSKILVSKYEAPIRGIAGKNGVLRVVCWNWKLERYHYFLIPKSAYIDLNCTVKISFDKNTILPNGKYAQYEVENFEAVSAPLTHGYKMDTILSNIVSKNIEESAVKIKELYEKGY